MHTAKPSNKAYFYSSRAQKAHLPNVYAKRPIMHPIPPTTDSHTKQNTVHRGPVFRHLGIGREHSQPSDIHFNSSLHHPQLRPRKSRSRSPLSLSSSSSHNQTIVTYPEHHESWISPLMATASGSSTFQLRFESRTELRTPPRSSLPAPASATAPTSVSANRTRSEAHTQWLKHLHISQFGKRWKICGRSP